jgi:hypothetical protein
MMAKLICCSVFVLLAMAGAHPALAQVPGGGGEAVCTLDAADFDNAQTGGLFPAGPAFCQIGAGTQASVAIRPFAFLSAAADAAGIEEDGFSAATAIAEFQYDFAVTGGNPGDPVPVLVLTSLEASASESPDASNANSASAIVALFGLSSVGGAIVSNGPGTFACQSSPVDCTGQDEVQDDLAVTVPSGSAERVFLQVIVAANSKFHGHASAQIDPFIRIDPSFPNAADYEITVAGGVGNALPVPEPSVLALLLAGLGGLSTAARLRRSRSWRYARMSDLESRQHIDGEPSAMARVFDFRPRPSGRDSISARGHDDMNGGTGQPDAPCTRPAMAGFTRFRAADRPT